jgi:hypothetical protein
MEAAISPTLTVIAHGAFTASGVDHTGDSVDTIVFSDGTFKFRHSPGKGPTRFNAKTCLGSENQHGTYKIFGGTGAYQGISGHGTYHLNLLLVAARNADGTCSDSKEPTGFQLVVRAPGPVHL